MAGHSPLVAPPDSYMAQVQARVTVTKSATNPTSRAMRPKPPSPGFFGGVGDPSGLPCVRPFASDRALAGLVIKRPRPGWYGMTD